MNVPRVPNPGDMLDGAEGAEHSQSGGGRIELRDQLRAVRSRLAGPVRRRFQKDVPSMALLFAYVWTATYGLTTSFLAVSGGLSPYYLAFTLPVAGVGLVGIAVGASFWALIPALLTWLLIAVAEPTATGATAIGLRSFGLCFAIGLFVGGRSLVTRRVSLKRGAALQKMSANRLGWDLYRLSTAAPATDETTSPISVFKDLQVGEVQRHFDQVTSAAIAGGIKHVLRFDGTSGSIHNLPFISDTRSWMGIDGAGFSSVQLGMNGTTRDDLTSDAFVAVFERPLDDGVDTLRAVVPSESQARAFIGQLLAAWSAQQAANSAQELMIRRYSGAITAAVSSDSSYVADRLGSILRMPAPQRPPITVIGDALNQHAVLVGGIRFGTTGPLYQLFPIATVRALLALMEGRPLPRPPAGLPPTDASSSMESSLGIADAGQRAADAEAAPNGEASRLTIRTLGGLRIGIGSDDVTKSLLDRKVLAFVWLYLMARRMRNPHDTITRASLADELSPGLDSSNQRARLRGRLSEMRNELPPALGRRVQVSGERIGLDLAGCQTDVLDLFEAESNYRSSNGVLSSLELAELESALASGHQPFLPEWDDIEHHVNSGRGGAGEVVADLRRRVEAARSVLLRALGTSYLAHGKAEAAVDALERALDVSPEDEAVAKSLIAACLQAGRIARAEQLRKDFSLV